MSEASQTENKEIINGIAPGTTITRREINELAESSVKVTQSTNASKLYFKFKNNAEKANIQDLSTKIRESLYDAAVFDAIFDSETEQETRSNMINHFMDAITQATGKKRREEKPYSTTIPDYTFRKEEKDIRPKVVVEAKSKRTRLFNSKNNVNLAKSSQAVRYINAHKDEHCFCAVILTNGLDMIVYMTGIVECKYEKNKGWQPLRNELRPILTLSCASVSKETCDVLAYIIAQALRGNEDNLLGAVREVYENEVKTLETAFESRGIEIID